MVNTIKHYRYRDRHIYFSYFNMKEYFNYKKNIKNNKNYNNNKILNIYFCNYCCYCFKGCLKNSSYKLTLHDIYNFQKFPYFYKNINYLI